MPTLSANQNYTVHYAPQSSTEQPPRLLKAAVCTPSVRAFIFRFGEKDARSKQGEF